jgi:hypothetical protein
MEQAADKGLNRNRVDASYCLLCGMTVDFFLLIVNARLRISGCNWWVGQTAFDCCGGVDQASCHDYVCLFADRYGPYPPKGSLSFICACLEAIFGRTPWGRQRWAVELSGQLAENELE